MTAPIDLKGLNLIVFDGTCVLCNGGMKFIMRFDKHKKFVFCTAQSAVGQGLYDYYGLEKSNFDTFLVILDGHLYEKLDGIIAINRILGWPWKVFTIARFLPKQLKNWMYDCLAKNRYSIFGQYDTCMIPDQSIKDRFIDQSL